MDRRRWTGIGGRGAARSLCWRVLRRAGRPQQAPGHPLRAADRSGAQGPGQSAKMFRVDFARVEQDFPLSRARPDEDHAGEYRRPDPGGGRPALRPADRRTDPRRPATCGDLFFARADDGEGGDRLRTRLEEILGGIHGRVAGRSVEFLEELGRRLWKGKVFYRDERILRNIIENVVVLRPLSTTSTASGPPRCRAKAGSAAFSRPTRCGCCSRPSSIAGRACRRPSRIGDRRLRLHRRRSTATGAVPDVLAGRGGLQIRDEIRMIRPGFYLGRAYTEPDVPAQLHPLQRGGRRARSRGLRAGDAVAEDCWPGEQARRTAVR